MKIGDEPGNLEETLGYCNSDAAISLDLHPSYFSLSIFFNFIFSPYSWSSPGTKPVPRAGLVSTVSPTWA